MLRWQYNLRVARTISSCRSQSSHPQDAHYEDQAVEREEEEEDNGVPAHRNAAAISVLCDAGHLHKAMELLDQQGFPLPQGIYWSLLKLCNQRKSLHYAKHVHAHMHNHLALHSMPPTIYEYLILTFVKCGDLESALQVFCTLPHRTVFAWTAVISGYTESGEGEIALRVYARMLEECVHPNEYTYVSLLKACGNIPNLQMGKTLHAHAWSDGLHSHVIITSSLVSMYGKGGAVADAEKTFFASPQHDVVSWTSMLSVFVEQGLIKEAISLYKQMQKQDVTPNEWTVSACLQGCSILTENKETSVLEGKPGNMMPLEIGWMLHTDACYRGFDRQFFVGNSLIRMYGKCGCTSEAEIMFGSLSDRNVVSWTSLLSLYVEQGEAEKALKVYRQMQESDINPDKLAFVIILQACCIYAALEGNNLYHAQSLSVLLLEIGQALHADARRKCLDSDAFVGNTLVHLFVRCGKYIEAEAVFAELCQRDVVSWTVMLRAYIEQGQARKALQLYQQMQKEGVSPDERTFVNVLQACCKFSNEESEVEESVIQVALEMGKALHSDALERGFDHSMYFGSILVNLYGQCGSISEAEYSFKRLSQPDAIAHSAMLSAYVEENQGENALQLYKQMLTQGVNIDDATQGCMLRSCSTTGSLEDCRHLHHSILWTMDNLNPLLATGLIHAYASCASSSDAEAMLNSLLASDVVSWNALMAGFVQAGDYDVAFQKFEDMLAAGVNPNEVTFLPLLSACCQIGLTQKGVKYFESMSEVYHVTPKIHHYGSIIDLLGRAGDFNRIEELLSTMQMQPDLAMWLGLLGACRVHGNVDLGKLSYDHAVRIQPKQAAAYVLMSNMYVDAGMQDQASEVDLFRQKACAWKKPGKSWILVNERIHTFVVKESLTLREECFFHVLQKKHTMLRLNGHIPQTDQLSS